MVGINSLPTPPQIHTSFPEKRELDALASEPATAPVEIEKLFALSSKTTFEIDVREDSSSSLTDTPLTNSDPVNTEKDFTPSPKTKFKNLVHSTTEYKLKKNEFDGYLLSERNTPSTNSDPVDAEKDSTPSPKTKFKNLVPPTTEYKFDGYLLSESNTSSTNSDPVDAENAFDLECAIREPHNATERIFQAIAEYTKTMGGLHGSFLDLVKVDIENFENKTKQMQGQMKWQGKMVIGLSSLSFAMGVAGAFVPKTAVTPPTTAAASRLNANSIGDKFNEGIKWIAGRFQDSNFLRTTCKSGSTFLNTVTGPVNTFQQAKTTEIESQRALLERFNLQDGQSKKSTFENQVQMAQQSASRILDSKSKGG